MSSAETVSIDVYPAGYSQSRGSQPVAFVEYDDLEIGDAEPVNCGTDGGVVWVAPVRLPDGRRGKITYSFSAAEEAEAGEFADTLPWDAEHVECVELCEADS